MVDINQNCVTKVIIMVISSVIAVECVLIIVDWIANDRNFKTSTLLTIIAGIVLSVLAFIGAYQESALLSYISLGACVVALALTAWRLFECMDDREWCEDKDYWTYGILIVILIILAILVFQFVMSLKK